MVLKTVSSYRWQSAGNPAQCILVLVVQLIVQAHAEIVQAAVSVPTGESSATAAWAAPAPALSSVNDSLTPEPVLVTPPSEVFPRLDITTLVGEQDKAPQLDLFLQAFARVQARPPTSPTSYFQIAGIHGKPYRAWDGVQPDNRTAADSQKFAGYCWHASVLFPTWHRPYALLMEQEVRAEAAKLAMEYPVSQRAVYVAAARQLRFPYWDWTSGDSAVNGLPGILVQPTWQVVTPAGRATIANPLATYTFPENVSPGEVNTPGKDPGEPPSYRGAPILRHPDADLEPQVDALQEEVQIQVSDTLQPAWYRIFTDPGIAKSWAAFATHAPSGTSQRPVTTSASIEGIHDLLHDAVGGLVYGGAVGYPGHMSDVDVAAFDPIFYLHHCNVDRLTALFQAKNPDTWLQPTLELHQSTFMTGPGGYQPDATTPLWPFRMTETEFFTSDDVRNITKLGYSYPELLQATQPYELFGSAKASKAQAATQLRLPATQSFRPDNYNGFRWYLNVQNIPLSLFNGSTLIHVCLHANTTQNLTDMDAAAAMAAAPNVSNRTVPAGVGPNDNCSEFAGSIAIFTRARSGITASHQGHGHEIIHGQVELTRALQRLGLITPRPAAAYAELGAEVQPTPAEQPPARLVADYVMLVAAGPVAADELDAVLRQGHMTITWGRTVNGYQVVGNLPA